MASSSQTANTTTNSANGTNTAHGITQGQAAASPGNAAVQNLNHISAQLRLSGALAHERSWLLRMKSVFGDLKVKASSNRIECFSGFVVLVITIIAVQATFKGNEAARKGNQIAQAQLDLQIWEDCKNIPAIQNSTECLELTSPFGVTSIHERYEPDYSLIPREMRNRSGISFQNPGSVGLNPSSRLSKRFWVSLICNVLNPIISIYLHVVSCLPRNMSRKNKCRRARQRLEYDDEITAARPAFLMASMPVAVASNAAFNVARERYSSTGLKGFHFRHHIKRYSGAMVPELVMGVLFSGMVLVCGFQMLRGSDFALDITVLVLSMVVFTCIVHKLEFRSSKLEGDDESQKIPARPVWVMATPELGWHEIKELLRMVDQTFRSWGQHKFD